MPLYDYECRDCGHQAEIRQSFSEDALTECPNCQGRFRRVIAPVGIVFKGGGYYKTDSRKPKANAKPSWSKRGEESAKGDTSSGDGDQAKSSDSGTSGSASSSDKTESSSKPATDSDAGSTSKSSSDAESS